MLEHLTGDVEGEVLGVHHALDKAEVLGQQIGALVQAVPIAVTLVCSKRLRIYISYGKIIGNK